MAQTQTAFLIQTQLSPAMTALKDNLGTALISVVLFGSQARGEARPDSDWDMLIISSSLPNKPFQRHLHLKQILPAAWRAKISILAKTPQECEARLSSLWLDIALDGLILYDPEGYMQKKLSYLKKLITKEGLYRKQDGADFVWQWQSVPENNWFLEWEAV